MMNDFDWKKLEEHRTRVGLDQPINDFEVPTELRARLKWMFFSFDGRLKPREYDRAFWILAAAVITFVAIAFLTAFAPFLGLIFVLILPFAWACLAVGVKRLCDTGANGNLFFLFFFVGFGLPVLVALLFIETDQFT